MDGITRKEEQEEKNITDLDSLIRLGYLDKAGNRTFISSAADQKARAFLEGLGRTVITVTGPENMEKPVKDHPDIYICKLGISDDSPVTAAMPEGAEYPESVGCNAACTGKFFIHNLKYTSKRLLDAAEKAGFTMIDVRQGYAKCSIVIVDESSIITYDKGIERACSAAGMDVLLIRPVYIRLDGYDTGFIGGTSGRIGDTVVFYGDPDTHPDGDAIKDFILSKGLKISSLKEGELTDIGSII